MFLPGLAAAMAIMAAVFCALAIRQRQLDSTSGADVIQARIRGADGQRDDRPKQGRSTAPRAPTLLERADAVGMSSALLATIGIGGAAAGGLLLWGLIEAPLLVALGAVGGATMAPSFLVRFREKQRMTQLNDQFQAALDQLVAGLRSGASLHMAIEHVAAESPEPLQTEFRMVARSMAMHPVEDAVQQLVERIPTREVEVFATAVAFQSQTGGSLTEVLVRVSDLIRERGTFEKQVSALVAESRMTSWLMVGMPIVLLAAFRLMAWDYMHSITSSLFGQTLVGAALIMVVVGAVIVQRMIVRVVEGAG